MFEIFLMVVLLPASITFNIILLFRAISFVKRNEEISDLLSQYNNRHEETLMKLELMLNDMKEIDLGGSFEADDEVGSVFTELKNTIQTYKNEI